MAAPSVSPHQRRSDRARLAIAAMRGWPPRRWLVAITVGGLRVHSVRGPLHPLSNRARRCLGRNAGHVDERRDAALTMRDANRQAVGLSDGRPVVVVAQASGCAPCVAAVRAAGDAIKQAVVLADPQDQPGRSRRVHTSRGQLARAPRGQGPRQHRGARVGHPRRGWRGWRGRLRRPRPRRLASTGELRQIVAALRQAER